MTIRAESTVRQRLGLLVIWLLPLLVIAEYLSGAIPKPAPVRVIFFGLFLGAFWLSRLPESEIPERLKAPLRTLGLLLAALGAACLLGAAWGLLAGKLGLTPLPLPAVLDRTKTLSFMPVLGAWPMVLGLAWGRGRRLAPLDYQRLGLLIALAFGLQLLAGQRVQGLPVLPQQPWASGVLLLCCATLLALSASGRGSFAVRLGVLVGAGFALQLCALQTWQIDPRTRDMLPLVDAAQRAFAQGHNPYAIYAMQRGSEVPLTYFPGMWLGYGLPRVFGLDLRFAGLLAQAALAGLLGLTAKRTSAPRRAWAQAIVIAFCALWFFSPSVLWNTVYAEPPVWWGALGVLLCLVVAGSPWQAAVLLGLALATRHFAVVLAPFLLLFFAKRDGWSRGLAVLALAGCITSALLLPFALQDPELFWFGTFRWLREYGPVHISWFHDRFSFMHWFAERDALAVMPAVQWGQAALLLVAALFVKPVSVLGLGATAYVLFMMLNMLFWDSFLLDGALLAIGLVLARASELAARAPLVPRLRVASYAALACVAICAGLLVRSLLAETRKAVPREAHDLMVRSVRAGAAVLDRSDRRLAFVHGNWLLKRGEVPAPIGSELYDGAWAMRAAPEQHDSLWLVTDDARDRSLRDMFPLLGSGATHQTFGRFHVQSLRSHAARKLDQSVQGGAQLGPCPIGRGRPRTLLASLGAGAPVELSWSGVALGQTLLVAAGFFEPQVVWPHTGATLEVSVDGRALGVLVVPNLHGFHWLALDTRVLAGKSKQLMLRARTNDPELRGLCVDVTALDAR